MFRRYFLFEMKRLLYNRKNLFLGCVLLLFFPIFILYAHQTPSESLRDVKKEEAEIIKSIFNVYADELQEGTPEEQAVYENLLKQSSLVNFQVFYMRAGEVTEDYIENGLALTELRLQAHEIGNQGMPDYAIISEEEILKEDALLRFLQEENIVLDANSFVAENQFVTALALLSGLPFVFFVLLSGSDILVSEQRHKTVMSGFPLSFMTKINAKVFLHFMYIMLFLVAGLFIGNYFMLNELGNGVLRNPVVIYNNGGFEAIPLIHYLTYSLLAMAAITVLILYLSVLLNILFKNAYANVLIGLGLFLLPGLFLNGGGDFTLLHPLKYIEFSNVLSGFLATQLGNSGLDFGTMLLWLLILCAALMMILFVKNKLTYLQEASQQTRTEHIE